MAAHFAFVLAAAITSPTRRTVILGAPFAPAILSARPRAAWAVDAPPSAVAPRSILITGGNSGIGYEAARKLVAEGHSVTLACRTQARADAAASAVNSEAAASGRASAGSARGIECDLASLASVRQCAAAFLALKAAPIDVLVLNAAVAPGTQQTSPKRTSDGFEETIGVNHLGHFLLTALLSPALAPRGGRVVVTASEVHNPEEPGGQVGSKASLGELGGLRAALRAGDGRFEMADGGAYDPDKAYKDSKLCNMLFMAELDRRLQAEGRGVCANAFSPGLITKTGLFRNQRPLFVAAFDFVANNVARFGETPEYGGGCIDFMATAAELEGQHGLFYSDYPPGKHTLVRRVPSAEARDERKAAELWALSEKLVGLA